MKTTIKLTIALLLMLIVNNCTKIKERKKTTINLKLLNPITKEGCNLYSGIPFLLEKRTYPNKKSSSLKKAETICEGAIDSEGKANIEFFRVINHDKVKYRIYVEFGVSGLDYYQYGGKLYIDDIAQDKVNNAIFYVGENVNFVLHVKNTNCFDANDQATYKVGSGIFTGNDFFNTYVNDGCYNQAYNYTVSEDYYPYTLTVTRNGQTIVTQDTFKIEQGMDTLKWYY